jgi:hypothetical protein
MVFVMATKDKGAPDRVHARGKLIVGGERHNLQQLPLPPPLQKFTGTRHGQSQMQISNQRYTR